jgi:hypothetical protein
VGQDRGEASHDPAYERVLAGLALVASHSAQALQDALLSWRRDALNQAARAPGELLILRKRVIPPFPCHAGSVTPQAFHVHTCTHPHAHAEPEWVSRGGRGEKSVGKEGGEARKAPGRQDEREEGRMGGIGGLVGRNGCLEDDRHPPG